MMALQCRETMRTESAKISGKPVRCRACTWGSIGLYRLGGLSESWKGAAVPRDAMLGEGNGSMGLTWKEYSWRAGAVISSAMRRLHLECCVRTCHSCLVQESRRETGESANSELLRWSKGGWGHCSVWQRGSWTVTQWCSHQLLESGSVTSVVSLSSSGSAERSRFWHGAFHYGRWCTTSYSEVQLLPAFHCSSWVDPKIWLVFARYVKSYRT